MTNRVRTDLYLYALVNNLDLDIKLLSVNAESLVKGGAFASLKEVSYCMTKLQEKRDSIAALRANSDKLDTLQTPMLTSTEHQELAAASREVDASIMRLAQHVEDDNLPDAPCDAKTTGIALASNASPGAPYTANPTRKVAVLKSDDATDDLAETSPSEASMVIAARDPRDILPFLHGEIDNSLLDGE